MQRIVDARRAADAVEAVLKGIDTPKDRQTIDEYVEYHGSQFFRDFIKEQIREDKKRGHELLAMRLNMLQHSNATVSVEKIKAFQGMVKEFTANGKLLEIPDFVSKTLFLHHLRGEKLECMICGDDFKSGTANFDGDVIYCDKCYAIE